MIKFSEKKSKDIISNIREILKKYIINYRLKSLVVGVSGGIDSALCSYLALPICNEINIPLIGRSIPILTNKEDEIERARLVGQWLTTDFEQIDLSKEANILFDTMKLNNINNDIDIKVRKGNIKARLRMIYLYDLARKTNGIVLSTDNLTEYKLGFWTLHGDVGDFGMIQKLWKSEIYQLAEYIIRSEKNCGKINAIKACAEAVPTDGLGITKSDFEQFGDNITSYEQIDKMLNYEDEITVNLYEQVNKTNFKRCNPYNILRDRLLEDLKS